MDVILESATQPWGEQRFFPPGSHPAMAQQYQQVKTLESMPSTPERDEMLAYGKELIAKWEQGESEAKMRYLFAHR